MEKQLYAKKSSRQIINYKKALLIMEGKNLRLKCSHEPQVTWGQNTQSKNH